MLERVGGWTRRRDKGHMITCAHGGWLGGWGLAGSMIVDLTTSAFQSVCGQVCVNSWLSHVLFSLQNKYEALCFIFSVFP